MKCVSIKDRKIQKKPILGSFKNTNLFPIKIVYYFACFNLVEFSDSLSIKRHMSSLSFFSTTLA